MGGDSSTEPSPPAPAAIAPVCARRVHDRHEEDRSGREVSRSCWEYCRAVRPFRGHCWYSLPLVPVASQQTDSPAPPRLGCQRCASVMAAESRCACLSAE